LTFGAIRSHLAAGGFVPQCESLAGLWMEILAQAYELVAVGVSRQSESLGTFADPLARDGLALRVVIANGEVLLEIPLGILQIVLCFGHEHDREITVAGADCVSEQRAGTTVVRANSGQSKAGDERASVNS
jgi:hypothetical protein